MREARHFIEHEDAARTWKYEEIRDICRRELEKFYHSNDRTLEWNNTIYTFAQDHLTTPIAREELKEKFREIIEEIDISEPPNL